MFRLAALLYGGLCYAFAMATIVYAVAFTGALPIAPKTIDAGGPATAALAAAIIDLVLLGIFAVQHSVMARPAFKAAWTKIVPPAIERSTYVLCAALALALLIWQWRPIDGIVWQTNGVPAAILSALFWLGWFTVVFSTYLINHFDLFGLAQVWSAWRGSERPQTGFRSPLLYKVVRHPIYLGFLMAFWATPVMTWGHALFAAGSTAYVLIGIWLEERDLVAHFGETYLRYRARVSMLIPLPPKNGG